MGLDFSDKVAIVTGAGGGLGREHALALARRGAKVLVNDPGGAVDGQGNSSAAEKVVREIEALGGVAMASHASVTDWPAVQAMVAQVVERWGQVDVLVNNAGTLRDKSFAKMEMDDFRAVLEVHLMGSVHCCKAVWPFMQAAHYGRILVTTSSSGLFGNFGQSNYAAAKMALVGLMQTLALEGAKYNIHVNALAPTAATRMTDGLLAREMLRIINISKLQNSYRLRLAKGTGTLQWLTNDGEQEVILTSEPESGFFQRFYNMLIAPIVPEMLL